MKLNQFLLFLTFVSSPWYANAEILLYKHSGLHLYFSIDTETKEATIGNVFSTEEHNAIATPPLDDPWWNESPSTNYWKDLDIPSTIICEGTAYNSNSNTRTIERATYTVVAIHTNAFYRSTYVQTVKLPETITSIGAGAFGWCIYLRSINIPSLVSSIDAGTFVWCNKLESIDLPKDLISIGSSAFSDCISLKAISIPGKCVEIAYEAFKWCTSLSTLTIEDGTTPLSISYCYNMGLNYEGNTPKHYRGMFSDCPIKQLYIGRDIEYGLNSSSNKYPPFVEYTYKGKDSNNKDIFFKGGKIFDEVTIGDNITIIPEALFQYAYIPNAISLPSHLVSIGDEAFSNISGTGGTLHQSQLVFPATLESVGKNAFTNCTSLGTIVCEGTVPPSLPDRTYYNAFSNCNPLFIVPTGCRATYLNAENWSKCKIVESTDNVVTINVKTSGTLLDRLIAQGYQLGTISRLKLKGDLNDDDWANVKKMSVLYDLDISEIELEEISANQFERSSLIYIKLPQTIKKIGDNAFYQSKSLTGIIEIPESCTEIGKQAFRETGITGLSYETPLHICEYAFNNCSNLEDVYIKGKGTIVDRYAFGSCGLKKLTIGQGVTLKESAVVSCDNLKEVFLEDGVKTLEDNSLYNKIEKIYFEGSVKNLGNSVFRNDYLKEIHISDIGKWCQLQFYDSQSHPLYKSLPSNSGPTLLYNDEELVNIEIPEGIERIGEYSFAFCDKLKSVKLSSTITNIGNHAFEYCSQLNNVQLSSNTKQIRSYAFYKCSSLVSIDFPQSLSEIGTYAFNGCNSLNNITAHWNEPITVSSNAFTNISSDCNLYIPIGTATKYSSAGWSCIPNIKPVGILSVKVNSGGSVNCLDKSLSEVSTELWFTPYNTIYIDICPQNGYRLMKIQLDGVNYLSEVVDGKITIEEPEENHNLIVVFAQNGIYAGDVNGDGFVNELDIKDMADYILKSAPQIFFDYAADMNDDGQINITDLLLLISNINRQ